jgi:hypothetical protein
VAKKQKAAHGHAISAVAGTQFSMHSPPAESPRHKMLAAFKERK